MKRADAIVNNLEQTQESSEAPRRLSREQLDAAHQTAARLMDQLADLPNGDLVGQIVATSLKLLRDNTNRGDMKLMNQAMKELRYALKVFSPYRDVRKVSIFGSARTPESHDDYRQAAAFARSMAADGWMVITGAGGGIMAAGHGGAGADPSFGLAIRLPFEQATNDFIARDRKLINFKYFFTRKVIFVRSCHAVAVFPGGFGTMDEAFEVMTLVQTGKSAPMPIVFVDRPGGDYWRCWQNYVENQLLARGLISPEDLSLYKITDDAAEAEREIKQFYRNFQSVRYARQDVIIRLRFRPTEKQLAGIARDFSHLAVPDNGNATDLFRVSDALPIEQDEPALADLPRLIFPFNRRDHGGLRRLIDHLNTL